MHINDQEYFRSCIARERQLAQLLGHHLEECHESAGTLWDNAQALAAVDARLARLRTPDDRVRRQRDLWTCHGSGGQPFHKHGGRWDQLARRTSMIS